MHWIIAGVTKLSFIVWLIERLEPSPTDRVYVQKEKLHKLWNLSDLLSKLVGVKDVRWNTIEASLVLMYTKMRDLGFVYDGENIIVPDEEVDNA